VDSDDAALIERCRAGDLAAFEPLVQKYRQRAYRLAYNVLRDADEAFLLSDSSCSPRENRQHADNQRDHDQTVNGGAFGLLVNE